MSNLIINDVPVEAVPGENLLSVARQNRAHIGFVCDGNGLCTTCEYRILEGEANLSAVNSIERNWLPPSRLDRGYRLACQSSLVAEGQVRILTRAEELSRLWNNISNPPPGRSGDEYLQKFTRQVIQLNIEHLSMFPLNLLRTVNRLGLVRTILPVRNNNLWLRDIGNIIDERSGYVFNDPSATQPDEIEL